MLAPLLPVCWGYTLVTGRLLLYRQGEFPLILTVLLVAAFCLDVTGMLLPCAAVKLLLAYAAASPLRQLACFAPRIISMPDH